MTRYLTLSAALIVSAVLAQDALDDRFQRAYYQEHALKDLDQAVETYRGVFRDALQAKQRALAARAKLPPELIYQLSSDTLTNFLDGTLESGKWTDATVFFGGVTASADVPQAIARIVNQYIAEHVALHDRPISELTVACAPTLAPWGIGFENDRAVVLTEAPEKGEILRQQFEAAMARKRR